MIGASVKAVRELSMQRLLEEIAMCQRLCDMMDKQLGAYMTILGRLGVLKVMQRIADLPEVHRASVFKKWAGEMRNYGPWTLVRYKLNKQEDEKFKLPEEANLQYFLNQDVKSPNHNRLLDPGFPWGALTLGGLMRAYAEMSEFIYGEVKDQGVLRLTKKGSDGLSTGIPYTDPKGEPLPSAVGKTGWQQQRIMEDQGRLSWQRNLIKMYGYDLFAKQQVQTEGLNAEEKKLSKKEQDDLLAKKKLKAQQLVKEVESTATPSEDRMRYVRSLKTVEEASDWLSKYKKLGPHWTAAGRVKWQTFLFDRISLIGDLYGLVRGATISGTTSDHAYSFFQLCHDVSIMDKQDARYGILTHGSTKPALGSGAWANQSTKQLEDAFAVMHTDEGFGRIIRMMMLIPVVQMGIEMHHSVHEMACVIGLNDMINWRVGYYDTLFMTLQELRRLENSVLAKMRQQAGIKQSTFTDPKLDNAGALATVENEIKKVLQETTKSVFHGYFVTADPYTVTLNSGDWGGVVMKSSRHSQVHKQNAVVGQTRMSNFNRQVTTGRGLGRRALR